MKSNESRRGHALRNALILLVLIAVVFGLRFRQLGQTEAVASIRSVQESEGIPVETVAVERADLEHWITLAGTVEGRVQYPVVSQNALRVVGIPVREGDRVRPGDVIIRLSTGAPSPMFHSPEKSRASYENALRDAQRLRNLYAEGAVARAELDAAETQLRVAEADLQDAEGSTSLRAAEAGIVTSILVEEGETVDTGKPLAWIIDTDQVKVRFAAGSAQALALATGQTAALELSDGVRTLYGEIGQLDLMADPETHLLEGEALFANDDGRLVPGLLVSFRVRTRHAEDVLAIPMRCLIDDGAAVWVVGGETGAETAARRPVVLGMENADRVEIVGGLVADEDVVLFGQTLLEDGVRVKRVGAGGED